MVRVRVIAMTGLVLVHTFCRWPVEHSVEGSARAVQYISSEWLKLIIANAEQFCILAVSTLFVPTIKVAEMGRVFRMFQLQTVPYLYNKHRYVGKKVPTYLGSIPPYFVGLLFLCLQKRLNL